ncbi:unnamed protein product [Amoebophrya sp. A120]|nr:unnamed protein product [Amoebophrya sp. A120]|eukprot:GSA120T00010871001.1
MWCAFVTRIVSSPITTQESTGRWTVFMKLYRNGLLPAYEGLDKSGDFVLDASEHQCPLEADKNRDKLLDGTEYAGHCCQESTTASTDATSAQSSAASASGNGAAAGSFVQKRLAPGSWGCCEAPENLQDSELDFGRPEQQQGHQEGTVIPVITETDKEEIAAGVFPLLWPEHKNCPGDWNLPRYHIFNKANRRCSTLSSNWYNLAWRIHAVWDSKKNLAKMSLGHQNGNDRAPEEELRSRLVWCDRTKRA